MTTVNLFDDLPWHILDKICIYLPARDMNSLCKTSQEMENRIKEGLTTVNLLDDLPWHIFDQICLHLPAKDMDSLCKTSPDMNKRILEDMTDSFKRKWVQRHMYPNPGEWSWLKEELDTPQKLQDFVNVLYKFFIGDLRCFGYEQRKVPGFGYESFPQNIAKELNTLPKEIFDQISFHFSCNNIHRIHKFQTWRLGGQTNAYKRRWLQRHMLKDPIAWNRLEEKLSKGEKWGKLSKEERQELYIKFHFDRLFFLDRA